MKHHDQIRKALRVLIFLTDCALWLFYCLLIAVIFGGWWLGY